MITIIQKKEEPFTGQFLPVNAKSMPTPANKEFGVRVFMYNSPKMTVCWNRYFGRSYRHSGRCFMHYWQLIGRSLTLRSQSPSARKLASVIATAFVEFCSK